MDLKKLRTELKLSQPAMAKKIGVALSTYCYWEYGKHLPSKLAMEKIEKLLEAQTSEKT